MSDKPSGMPLGRLARTRSLSSVARFAAVVAITGSVTLAAACSEEDVVDTIPPPRPDRTSSSVVGPTAPETTETTETTETPQTPSDTSTG